ncbi:MAG: GGDEF domain-containing protein, partial [Lachnospiraceae bacterium]|nr:GGDEF domain-containing protein [Lachnospiraceae bacterium]
KDKYYIVEFHRLENKKKKFLSSFVTIRDVSLEERKQREKRYLATHDSLTGIYNREYFIECVEKKLKENPEEQYVIVTSNYKNFKFLNDIYGREFCDNLLVMLADKIIAKASPDSLYARLNNDKFAMLINRKDFNEDIFL